MIIVIALPPRTYVASALVLMAVGVIAWYIPGPASVPSRSPGSLSHRVTCGHALCAMRYAGLSFFAGWCAADTSLRDTAIKASTRMAGDGRRRPAADRPRIVRPQLATSSRSSRRFGHRCSSASFIALSRSYAASNMGRSLSINTVPPTKSSPITDIIIGRT